MSATFAAKRVIIVAQGRSIQGTAIERAFRRLGWQTRLVQYGYVTEWTLWQRLFNRASRSYGAWYLARAFNDSLRREVLPGLDAGADLILFVKGEALAADVRAALARVDVPVVLWTLDSVSRFPAQMSVAPLATRTFVIDGGDVSGEGITWLPIGFDDELYRPGRGEPELDVLFAGNLNEPYYSGRRAALCELAQSSLPARFACGYVGSTGNRRQDRRLLRGQPLRWFGRVSPEAYGQLIARARIVVNIHQDDGSQPINPLFFGIPGARVCQVAESRPYLAGWLSRGDDYVAFPPGEMVPTVEHLLVHESERARVAAHGYRSAHAAHTFVQRVRSILDRVGLARSGG